MEIFETTKSFFCWVFNLSNIMQIKGHSNFFNTFNDFLSGPYYPTLFIQHRIHRTVKVPS